MDDLLNYWRKEIKKEAHILTDNKIKERFINFELKVKKIYKLAKLKLNSFIWWK